jgi:RNA polymerase sigma-70 factor (ECF subfamily)
MVLEMGLPQPFAASLADQPPDEQLAGDCKRGNLRAYERLYEIHAPRMKSIAFHMLGNRSDAEDAVQETFLKVFRAIDSFSGQSSLSTWICRILLNTCYDQGRKKSRLKEQPPALEHQHSTRTDIPLRVSLQSAINRLNERHRTVFLLFEVEGLRHSEIAGILDVPEGTSRTWLFEAKRELKRMLMEQRP